MFGKVAGLNRQLLIRLSKTQPQANLEQLEARYLAVAAREARLLAERDTHPAIKFPDWIVNRNDDSEVFEVISGRRTSSGPDRKV